MFAITADQVGSRRGADLVPAALARIATRSGDRLALAAERTAGDELQLLTRDAATALDLALDLARGRAWHVGLGVGDVDEPLPDSTRAASGPALLLARDAVAAAKRRGRPIVVGAADSATLQPVLDLLLQLRERRSPEGWELYDLLEAGDTQAEAAERLGITPQAASKRALAAGLKLDAAARRAIAELLDRAE